MRMREIKEGDCGGEGWRRVGGGNRNQKHMRTFPALSTMRLRCCCLSVCGFRGDQLIELTEEEELVVAQSSVQQLGC